MFLFLGELTLAYADSVVALIVNFEADLFGRVETELCVFMAAILFAKADTLLAHFFLVSVGTAGSVGSVGSVSSPVCTEADEEECEEKDFMECHHCLLIGNW
jgi:hypothetical protein